MVEGGLIKIFRKGQKLFILPIYANHIKLFKEKYRNTQDRSEALVLNNLFFLGIYASTSENGAKQGTAGTTAIQAENLCCWLVWNDPDDNFLLQSTPLPVAEAADYTLEKLLPPGYLPCVKILRQQTFYGNYRIISSGSRLAEAPQPVSTAPTPRPENSQPAFLQEIPRRQADETADQPENLNLEAELEEAFNAAMEGLSKDRLSAVKKLQAIATHPGPFKPEHKFLFTAFGSALRRRNLLGLACSCHSRALELAPDDEHIMLNLARVYLEVGQIDPAREYILRAIETNPNFSEAYDFLNFLNIDGGGGAD